MRVTLITHNYKDKRTGSERILVSHGVDENGNIVILPPEPPHCFGASMCPVSGEYYYKYEPSESEAC